MKEDYFNKPHRTIFAFKKKPKKLSKIPVPEVSAIDEEGEGEGEKEEEEKEKKEEVKKPKDEKKEEVKSAPSATSSFFTEGEESETSKSHTEESKSGPRNRRDSMFQENSKSEPEVLYEKPDNGDDGIEMNIFAADVNIGNYNTGADFDKAYNKEKDKF